MRKLLKRQLLVVLSPIIVLGLAELTLRIADIGYPTSFLVPRDIGGRRVHVDNPFFGYRFFPQRMTRTPAAIVLEKTKAPDVIRVFVLGESAAMGEPQSEFGLSRFLELLLADRAPGKRYEVVNAAMTAINSHVIVEIARDLASFQPDFFVVYMGNNEVVGPFGPGTVFENSGRLTPFRVRLTRLRLVQFLRTAAPGLRWSGMEMFNARRVAADDTRLDAVYDGFQGNLHRVIAIARKAGATVVLSTVPVNLRDCAPFSGDAADAAFLAGKLPEARDLDELRFRADSVINQIVRNVGTWAGANVRLVDTEKLFGNAGREVFVDHVHFNPAGNYRLACALAETIAPAKSLAPSLSDCLERMLYTDWNELDLTDDLIQRRRRPPFVGQRGNAGQLADLLRRKSELITRLQSDDPAILRQRYESAIQARPADGRLFHAWSEILMNTEDYGSAEKMLRRELELIPHRFDVYGALALVLGYQGRAAEGVGVLRDVPGKHGHFVPEFLLTNARTLARDRQYPGALAFAEEAILQAPENVDAKLELAARYATVGRAEAAEKVYRAVLVRDAANVTARDELAALLALQGRWDDAESVLLGGAQDAATRLKHTQLLLARGDLGRADTVLLELEAQYEDSADVPATRAQWHMLRGEWVEAETEFQRAIAIQPTPRSCFELARIYLRKNKLDDARAALVRGLELDPSDASCISLLRSIP